ncbi:MAG: SHS family sialic acid transporter-like MFS transporter [Verrucomicrobiales bacterium]|jgi:SHS family sialic acid transporter-like MFS transporter
MAILVVAALGWFFGGMQIAITNVAMRAAAIDLMDRQGGLELTRYRALSTADERSDEEQVQLDAWNGAAGKWYAWYQCAFLFGAAAGGYIFGRMGDRMGRTRALAISVIWFGAFTGLSYFVNAPWQLLLLRFMACLGIGGTWPNGVALVSEAWANVARPVMASLIGMAGNVGIFAMGTLAANIAVTPESWRWVMVVGAAPILLGILTWFTVKESPDWLARAASLEGKSSAWEVFQGRYRWVTVVGICLATIPLVGGWGSANWMIPWAGETGAATGDEFLKARVLQARSITSIVGSALAGSIACMIGRRTTYFITSLGSLAISLYVFWFSAPDASHFLGMVALLGFFNGLFFGWLPFFLPELFETRVRATGAGVSFNFGRILTAFTIFVTGTTMQSVFGGYAEIGRVTSWVFALGMIVILFAPDTSKRNLSA